MIRILPSSGKTRGLVKINDTLEIAAEFADLGYRSLPDITVHFSRSKYQFWRLVQERENTVFGCRVKIWEIDGEYVGISENGSRYTAKEAGLLEGISDSDLQKVDILKRLFNGEVINEEE